VRAKDSSGHCDFVRSTLVGDARIEHPEQNVNHIKLRDMDRTQVPVGGLALCFGATVETEARRALLEPFRHSNG
jgi:hypothetical protein